MRRSSSFFLSGALVLLSLAGVVQADVPPFGHSPLEPGQSATSPFIPEATKSITQSQDPNTLVPGTSVQCASATSFGYGWWRVFDLDDDHGIVGSYCVESVDYAVEFALGTVDLSAHVYCLDDGLPFETGFLVEVGSSSAVQQGGTLEFLNIEVGGCCDSGAQRLVVEIRNEDCHVTGTCTSWFIGMNDLGQIAPTYVSSLGCLGGTEPIDLALLGFPGSHLIMVVNGEDQSSDGVPASTSVGMLLIVLALLGGSALFLRRRAADGEDPE